MYCGKPVVPCRYWITFIILKPLKEPLNQFGIKRFKWKLLGSYFFLLFQVTEKQDECIPVCFYCITTDSPLTRKLAGKKRSEKFRKVIFAIFHQRPPGTVPCMVLSWYWWCPYEKLEPDEHIFQCFLAYDAPNMWKEPVMHNKYPYPAWPCGQVRKRHRCAEQNPNVRISCVIQTLIKSKPF